jgi:L-serine dehydratase
VDFYLHGSFAQTYRGHGTDKALLGGFLGFTPADERIRESFELARKQGLNYAFHLADLRNVHPNTVRIVVQREESSREMIGSSVGGGKVLVTSINNMKIEFTGQYNTIITEHQDRPGVIAHVSTLLSERGINIAFLKVFRQARGSTQTMVIETDQRVDEDTLNKLRIQDGVNEVSFVEMFHETGAQSEEGPDVSVRQRSTTAGVV